MIDGNDKKGLDLSKLEWVKIFEGHNMNIAAVTSLRH